MHACTCAWTEFHQTLTIGVLEAKDELLTVDFKGQSQDHSKVKMFE